MKIILIIICFIILLISCSSFEEPIKEHIEKPDKEPIEKPIEEDQDKIIEIIPTPGINLNNNSYEKIISPELIPIVEIRLPDDPILRIIELKNRYYIYNNLKESDFKDSLVTSIYSDNETYFVGTLRGGVIEYNLTNQTSHVLIKPRDSLYNISITG
ncbi:MAG: hypothetical protein PF518_19805, partial [Spirochaetaceae bacterium]|nr:hypothetical protein [Spirochaetaceae bacterium]